VEGLRRSPSLRVRRSVERLSPKLPEPWFLTKDLCK